MLLCIVYLPFKVLLYSLHDSNPNRHHPSLLPHLFFSDERKLEHDLRGKQPTAHPLCQPVRGQVPFLDAERGDARADRIRTTVSGGRV